MIKLKRLKILKYRNVKPGTELHFDDGVNLILGQNASGKTTLLALISAVCRSAFEGIKDEDFELEYEYQDERHAITVSVTHRKQATQELEAVPAPALWEDSYRLLIKDVSAQAEIFRFDSGTDRIDPRARVPLIMDWSLVAANLAHQKGELSVLRTELLGTLGSAFRFDESLDCFAAVTGRVPALKSPASPPAAFAGWRRTGGISVTEGSFVPGEWARELQRSFRAKNATPALADADKDFRERLAAALMATRVTISPNLRGSERTPNEESFRIQGFHFGITRPGVFVSHDDLSYGQKRLLSFLYYLELNPAVVIADELVNGLHHRWIESCMKAIGDRQAFLTSQNPLLFDYVEFDSVEQARSRFITCKLEQAADREYMVWENMSEDDATRFYEAYQAGIEHVGDILITRGMW